MHRENTNAHPPKDGDKPAPLHWRQRKKLVARRKQLEEEAAARKPQMIQAYIDELGGNVSPIQMADVERVVDLDLITAETRAAVRLGIAKISDLTRLEGAADRARRRLCLPEPGSSAAPSDDAWRKFLAENQQATDEGDG